MTNRGAAVLGLRLLALFILVSWLFRLPETVAYLFRPVADVASAAVLEYLVVFVLLLPPVLALLLWWGVGRWVELILPARTAEAPDQRLAPGPLQGIAYSTAGLLVLLHGLPELLRAAYAVYASADALDGLAAVSMGQWIALSAVIVQLVLALLLTLGAPATAALIQRLRRAGAA